MITREGSRDPLELLRKAEDLSPPVGAQERVAALLLASSSGLVGAPLVAAHGLAGLGGATVRQLVRRFVGWSLIPLAAGVVIGARGEALLIARRAPRPVASAAVSGSGSVSPTQINQADSAQPASPIPSASNPGAVHLPPKLGAAELLAQERSVLDRAREKMASNEPGSAERYLAQHAQRFPAGRLREEREAMLINVLVRLGRIEQARARSVAFKRQYPSSLMLSAVNAALAADLPTNTTISDH